VTKQNIKIPAKHYVGMVKRQNEKIPLGFITPWGEDAAAKKRIATVDAWSKQRYHGNTALPAMTIDNVPMSGFKMTTDIRSSSYGGVDKWRIEDPRGFELEITSHNLAQLLTVGMIDRGEIADTCVWARDGQNNVLLSTSTDIYKEAVQNTQVAAMTANWKDVKIGNTVLLQNNVTGVWLGRMHGVSLESYTRYDEKRGENQLTVTDKSIHVIYINNSTKTHKHTLLLVNSPKLASITDDNTMSETDAEELVNRLLTDKTCYIDSNGYRSYLALTIGSAKIGINATLSLRKISVNDKQDLEKLVAYPSVQYVYQVTDDRLYRITASKDYRTNQLNLTCNAYDKQAFLEHKIIPVGRMTVGSSYWNKTSSWMQDNYDYVFDQKDEFYTVVVTINTKSGSTIEAILR
jgi:hypothetical protein